MSLGFYTYTHMHIYAIYTGCICLHICKLQLKNFFLKNYSWTFFFSKEGIQIANMYMKGHSLSLVIREIQIRTTPVRMAISKKSTNKCQKVRGVREPLYTMEVPQKTKNGATTWSNAKKSKNLLKKIRVPQCAKQHCSQWVRLGSDPNVHWQVLDEEDVVHVHDGRSLSLEKGCRLQEHERRRGCHTKWG